MCSFSLSSTSSSWPCSLAASLPARAAPREAGEPEGGGHRDPRGGHHGVRVAHLVPRRRGWRSRWHCCSGSAPRCRPPPRCRASSPARCRCRLRGCGADSCEPGGASPVLPARSRHTWPRPPPRSPRPGSPHSRRAARRERGMAGARASHAPPHGEAPAPPPPRPRERPHHLRMRRGTCPSHVSLSVCLSLIVPTSLPVSLTLSLPFSLSRRYVHPCSLSIPAPLPVLTLSSSLVPERKDVC